MKFDPTRPYDALPQLPPISDVETAPILKQCLKATRALAHLKGAGGLIPDQAILIVAQERQTMTGRHPSYDSTRFSDMSMPSTRGLFLSIAWTPNDRPTLPAVFSMSAEVSRRGTKEKALAKTRL